MLCVNEAMPMNIQRNRIRTDFFSATRAIGAFLFALLLTGMAPAQTPAIPTTPAGQALAAFLDGFNSGDKAKLADFIQKYSPDDNADDLASFAADTGGFTLLSIEHSAPRSISFRAREKANGEERIGHFVLSSADPPKVESWGIRMIPPGATVEYTSLDASARQKVIDAVSAKLTEYYVYPEVGQKMVAALHDHERRGDYNTLTDGYAFAAALHRDLREISHDKHLRVMYDPFKRPGASQDNDKPHEPSPEDKARRRAEFEHENCLFSKVEILSQNIGYIKFDGFMPPEICGPTATAALNFIAHTDAVIVDLRSNGGGDPAMVQYVASYFFSEATHINDIYSHHDDSTQQYWTLAYVDGPRITKPLYVLTSKRTFSGAEEFTYDMQTQKRATIVGETTGGGAHPVRGMPVAEHFIVGVPFARPINPVTKKDWEGTGVEPDVKVDAAAALDTAQKLAIEKIHAK
jgi:hypothetical protein